jgi:hypothetical protein
MRGRYWASLFIAAWLPGVCPAAPPDDRGFDPSGAWQGLHGPLTLMRAGDTLSFTYSGVFGATAHMCGGIGVAGLVGPGQWDYVYAQGTVTFTTRNDRVDVRTTQGIASFCGANWPGDSFVRKGWTPPDRCTVTVPKARFHVVTTLPPPPRKGYLVKGDRVEALTPVNEGSVAWLLVRYAAKKQATAGLIERDALECE